MDRDLKILLATWKWIKWGLAAFAAWSSWKAAVLAYADGLASWQAILVGWLALLLAAAGLYYFLGLVDRAIEGIQRFKEGQRVAKLLDESVAVGHGAITITALAAIWVETFPQNDYIRVVKTNTVLRILKAAVRQGLIRPFEPTQSINVETFCDQKSAADFFRKRLWLEVRGDLWKEPA